MMGKEARRNGLELKSIASLTPMRAGNKGSIEKKPDQQRSSVKLYDAGETPSAPHFF
jgi:hypothetical protein